MKRRERQRIEAMAEGCRKCHSCNGAAAAYEGVTPHLTADGRRAQMLCAVCHRRAGCAPATCPWSPHKAPEPQQIPAPPGASEPTALRRLLRRVV